MKEPTPSPSLFKGGEQSTDYNYRRPEYNGNPIYVSAGLIEAARKLRKNQTPAEKIIWNNLRNKQLGGYKFNRQHIIGGYIIDFYCRKEKLAIEIDGSIHEEMEVNESDQVRQQQLEPIGIRFLRFSNQQATNQAEAVLATILSALQDPLP